jgi:DMSO/TMAO reductase YedYZ molybdopterin-dependent catalytic subunit
MKTICAVLLIGLIFIQSTCKKTLPLNHTDPSTPEIDITTTATPNGGVLKAAEDGPERSVLGHPEVDMESYTLTIDGEVDSSLTLDWTDIQQWHAELSDTILMYCVEGWEVRGNWKGILVSDLLQRASLKENATHVLFESLDNYSTALPIPYLEKYRAILAYEVNGQHLKSNDGFPLRLVAFGKFGYKWAKWVTRLRVLDSSVAGYWETYGYSDEANVPLSRRRYYEGSSAQPIEY